MITLDGHDLSIIRACVRELVTATPSGAHRTQLVDLFQSLTPDAEAWSGRTWELSRGEVDLALPALVHVACIGWSDAELRGRTGATYPDLVRLVRLLEGREEPQAREAAPTSSPEVREEEHAPEAPGRGWSEEWVVPTRTGVAASLPPGGSQGVRAAARDDRAHHAPA